MRRAAPDWSESDGFWEGLLELMFDPDRIERAASEVDDVEALLELPKGARVVDLCCGPGRHAVQLALRGHQVVGVDRTGRYLEVARERAAAAGVEVDFVRADAREFRCDPPADAVLNLWTSFGYFEDPEDNLLLLRQAHASLREGGALLLQTRSKETFSSHLPVQREWWERDGVLYLEERYVVDDWSRAAGRWVVVDQRGRHDFPWISWLYSGASLKRMLAEVGFRSVSLHGDLTGSPYDLRAKHLVAVARK